MRRELTAAIASGRMAHWAADHHGAVPVWTDRPLDISPESGQTLDYERMAALSDDVASWLHAAGVRRGDTVAVVKKNNPDILAVASGAVQIGAVPALVTSQMDPASANVVLSRLDKPFVVSDSWTLDSGALRNADVTALARRVVLIDGERNGTVSLDSLRGGPPAPAATRDLSDPAVIVHTSGTTGTPKLVLHSGGSIAASSLLGATSRFVGRRDTSAVCLSWVHVRAVTGGVAPLVRGLRIMALSDPDPDSVAEVFSAWRPTVVETHPNIFMRWEQLADHPLRPLENVRLYVVTADALHPRTIRKLLRAPDRRSPIFFEGYGMSETGPATFRTYTRWSPPARHRGRPRPPRTNVRIVDPVDGRVLGPRLPGAIELSTRSMFTTYVGEEARAAERKSGKWFRTTDVGELSRTRALRLLDRRRDQVPGLESCIETEDLLLARLEELMEVVILASPDGGPVPVVCTHRDAPLDPARWAEATRDLSILGAPRQVPFGDLPLTSTWKVRRFRLAEQIFRTPPA
ncbi:MAG: acyl--CoA ligase [Actinomycetota bacterium]|nr:acyl--CoA ligase [Actinomycetota bacterium]